MPFCTQLVYPIRLRGTTVVYGSPNKSNIISLTGFVIIKNRRHCTFSGKLGEINGCNTFGEFKILGGGFSQQTGVIALTFDKYIENSYLQVSYSYEIKDKINWQKEGF